MRNGKTSGRKQNIGFWESPAFKMCDRKDREENCIMEVLIKASRLGKRGERKDPAVVFGQNSCMKK